MNEEAIKTKADKDKEVKKWTTFLQKPNRPIPKSKEEVQYEPYRVKIVKQPKPMCDPNRVHTPPTIEAIPAPTPNEIESIENTETQINVVDGADANGEVCRLADSEVPDLEECDTTELAACEIAEEDAVKDGDENGGVTEEPVETVETGNKSETVETVQATSPPKENVLGGGETQLERQLLDVQNQLATLSTLPSTIQTMLESVSRQLNEILPAFKLRTSIDLSGSIDNGATLQITEKIDFEKETNEGELHVEKVNNNDGTTTVEITDSVSQIKESGEVSVEVCTNVGDADAVEPASDTKQIDAKLSNDEIARETEEQIVKMKTERVFQMQEEDWSRNKVGIYSELTFQKWRLIESFLFYCERKHRKVFRWRKNKDASTMALPIMCRNKIMAQEHRKSGRLCCRVDANGGTRRMRTTKTSLPKS